MKYYFKLGKELKVNLFNLFVWLLICWLHVFRPSASDKSNFYLYLGIVWLILTIFSIVRGYNLIKLALKRRPLLEVDIVGIVDHVRRIKYNWNDIEEVIDGGGNCLSIYVNNPVKYLSQFKRGIDRFYAFSKKKKIFTISIDSVKANRKDLVNKLNDFSIKALELQEGTK